MTLATLSVTRTDGMTATFPLVWIDHPVNVDGEWTTTIAPSLTMEHDDALTDFVGHDILPTIAYLWIDGNGIVSADLDGCTYTLA